VEDVKPRTISIVSIELEMNVTITGFDPDNGDGNNPRNIGFEPNIDTADGPTRF
jgi:hypothetical protein